MFIDLTHRLNNDTPVYPGDPKIKITTADDFKESGYWGHDLQMGSHAGTHIDAPAHMIEGAKTLDKFDPDAFIGTAKYVLVEGAFDLSCVEDIEINSGDIVVFNTQMSYKFKNPEYFTDFPVMSQSLADFLVEKKVKMVGLDTCSADNADDFPIHRTLLGANILIIENLNNIEQLSGMKTILYALPLKLDIDGAPARVIADIR